MAISPRYLGKGIYLFLGLALPCWGVDQAIPTVDQQMKAAIAAAMNNTSKIMEDKDLRAEFVADQLRVACSDKTGIDNTRGSIKKFLPILNSQNQEIASRLGLDYSSLSPREQALVQTISYAAFWGSYQGSSDAVERLPLFVEGTQEPFQKFCAWVNKTDNDDKKP